MDCTSFRATYAAGGASSRSADLRAHLNGCAECRAWVADDHYRTLLGTLSVPDPGESYADRALARAWASRNERRRQARTAHSGSGWALAAAAVLVLALSLNLERSSTVDTQATVTETTDRVVLRQVDLLMVSPRDLPDAIISLELDPSLSLAGYDGRASLRWAAALAAGNNQLTLPVQLDDQQGGTLTVAVEAGGARKQLRLDVQPSGDPTVVMLGI